jgi:glucoamylase
MRLMPTLGLGAYLAMSCGTGAGLAQTTGAAPNCCGSAPVHDPAQKSMVGMAVNSTSSSVYFTGFRGNVSEVYYPTVDTQTCSEMKPCGVENVFSAAR